MTPVVELPLAFVLLPVSSSPARSETCTRSLEDHHVACSNVATNLLSFLHFLFNFSTKLIFSKLSVCLGTKAGSILQKGLKPSRCIPFRLPDSYLFGFLPLFCCSCILASTIAESKQLHFPIKGTSIPPGGGCKSCARSSDKVVSSLAKTSKARHLNISGNWAPSRESCHWCLFWEASSRCTPRCAWPWLHRNPPAYEIRRRHGSCVRGCLQRRNERKQAVQQVQSGASRHVPQLGTKIPLFEIRISSTKHVTYQYRCEVCWFCNFIAVNECNQLVEKLGGWLLLHHHHHHHYPPLSSLPASAKLGTRGH